MSTRCNILFKQGTNSILFYQHSDGYPKAIIPMLQEFFDWYGMRDVVHTSLDQITPRFIYWMINEQIKSRADSKIYKTEAAKASGTFSIDFNGELHGDIDYYYEVDFDEYYIRVFQARDFNTLQEFKPFRAIGEGAPIPHNA